MLARKHIPLAPSHHALVHTRSRSCVRECDRAARNSHYIRGVGGGSNDSVRVELVELPLVQVSQQTEGPCFRTVKVSRGERRTEEGRRMG